MRVLRWLGIATVLIGYAVLAHYTNATAHDGSLGAVVAITPVSLVALLLAWRSAQRWQMLGLLLLAGGGLWLAWSALQQHYGMVYWLEHVGMQLILLMTFGRTLIAGRQPLCTRFAEMVHAPEALTPRQESYARQVTVAWTLFFAAMALVSTLLFFFEPLADWSIFANFLTLPLVALMFVVEYLVRRMLLPDQPRSHILDAVRAYRASSTRLR